MTEETMKGLWQFETNKPNSCERCLYYEGKGTFTGDMLDTFFPDLTIIDEDTIKANLHPNCDCELHRSKEPMREKTQEKTDQELLKELIQDRVEHFKSLGPKYAAMSKCALQKIAKADLVHERTTLIKRLLKESDEKQGNVVGDLFGKSRQQILKEQEDPLKYPHDYAGSVGNLYGKTRAQILKEQEEEK
jgi:hypothetical protein